ncbi:hypothetical protein GOBAR_AA33817 [Gossypium barbadense]|uniref:RING-type E3 ubiquitin transferase n=1 Tax=Gossypium barbadense TaxID=3634 RepID=A0A2P5W710_GOSBA|nr:hypothetical protein GOBAR_AA33817 [Gossypium barbadense]
MFNLSRSIFLYLLTVVVVTAQSTAPPPRGDSYRLYSHFDHTMAIVVMVLVGAFSFVWILSIYIRHYDESYPIATAAAASSAQRFRPSGLDPEVIENFPVFLYSHVKNLKIAKRALECAVCLSEFEDDEALHVIPKCCHVFHLDCIDAWLAYHVTCPVCRAKLTPDSDDIALPVELGSNTTESDNNNTESSHPTRQRVEQQNELRNSGSKLRKGGLNRASSYDVVLGREGNETERENNGEVYTFSLDWSLNDSTWGEHGKVPVKVCGGIQEANCEKGGGLKRASSYDDVLEREGSWKKGGEGSRRGKSNIDRWVFSRTPPFVSKTGPLKSPKGSGGDWDDGSHSLRGLTSVKEKLYCLNLKAELGEKGSSPRPSI